MVLYEHIKRKINIKYKSKHCWTHIHMQVTTKFGDQIYITITTLMLSFNERMCKYTISVTSKIGTKMANFTTWTIE